MKTFWRNLWHTAREDRGVGAILVLLLLAGIMAAAGYYVSVSRMSQDATRLKQATDAAAQAAVMAWSADKDTDTLAVAQRYVLSNLGTDTVQLNRNLLVSIEPAQWNGYDGFKVSASFSAKADFLKTKNETVSVSSTAVIIKRPLEVALALPNTLNESDADIRSLRTLSEEFWDELIEDREDRMMALVPYSGDVNVWDDKKGVQRARSWAEPSRLSPPWFGPIRSGTGIPNLASPRLPNYQVKRMQLARGLSDGESFKWTEAPQGSFEIKINTAIQVVTNWPTMPFIQWTGPVLPPLGDGLSGPQDTRYNVGDLSLPEAALLPLTDSREDFKARLNKMSPAWEMNINMGMGWAAMALAPGFRGLDGWGSTEHPLDFATDGGNGVKAIVFISNLSGDLDAVDSDIDNYHLDWSYYGKPDLGEASDDPNAKPSDKGMKGIAGRVRKLCTELLDHQVLFYFLAVGPNPDNEAVGGKRFFEYIYPSLQTCRKNSSDFRFVDGKTIVDGEGGMREQLKAIAAELESQSNIVRLVQ